MLDSYTIGYYAGRFITKYFIYATGVKTVLNKYLIINTVAKAHKIASSDPVAVTKNLFDCLEFLD